MEIRLYTWETCPEVYKSLGPYTKAFFAKYEVTLIIVFTENNDSRDFTSAEIKNILSSFKNIPVDGIKGTVSEKKTEIYFWTNEFWVDGNPYE